MIIPQEETIEHTSSTETGEIKGLRPRARSNKVLVQKFKYANARKSLRWERWILNWDQKVEREDREQSRKYTKNIDIAQLFK